jgi:hypothetical protein
MGADTIGFGMVHRPEGQGRFEGTESPLNFHELFIPKFPS